MNDLITIGAAALVVLNIYVTVRLLLKAELTGFQKIAQITIIWIIPILGAFTILTFIKDDETPKGPQNPNDGQGVDGMPGGIQ